MNRVTTFLKNVLLMLAIVWFLPLAIIALALPFIGAAKLIAVALAGDAPGV